MDEMLGLYADFQEWPLVRRALNEETTLNAKAAGLRQSASNVGDLRAPRFHFYESPYLPVTGLKQTAFILDA
jgi:hypothetical protein